MRSATLFVLALALLAPYLSGFTLSAESSACQMACCKAVKQGCHRTAHHHDPDGPRWTRTPSCQQGCGQGIFVPGSIAHAAIAAGTESAPLLHTALLSQGSTLTVVRTGVEFALFERPPPSFS